MGKISFQFLILIVITLGNTESLKGDVMSVNKVILLGRLGQDPELKTIPTGQVVCNFSVATSDSWKDKSGQKQERTEWHSIVVWGKLGELCIQ